MREIKYRAWIKDYTLMADVNFLNIDYKEIVVMIDENDYEFNCGEYELMQYTGLKDENGTEIYEGDIVKFNGIDNATGEVRYNDVIAMFQVINRKGGAWGLYPETYVEIEVIGNIYEHPQLI